MAQTLFLTPLLPPGAALVVVDKHRNKHQTLVALAVVVGVVLERVLTQVQARYRLLRCQEKQQQCKVMLAALDTMVAVNSLLLVVVEQAQ